MTRSIRPAWLLAAAAACAPAPALEPPRPSVDPMPPDRGEVVMPPARVEPERAAPPEEAKQAGLMALDATRVAEHVRLYPGADGRGVLIGILDSGIDLSTPGLGMTSTGDPKVLDLRDFSGEGRVELRAVQPDGDAVEVGPARLTGFGRVRALNPGGPWYGGLLRELPLGELPGADVDRNGVNTDELPVIVTRATDGWVLFADTDRDGSLDRERPVRDYLVARETFGWRTGQLPSPLTMAVNFTDGPAGGPPVLDLVFDQSSHGTHVAAIAAGRDMFGVRGFDGVAPGAMLLGLKISNNALGGLSVTGSKLMAIDYAIRFARQRGLPLVLNLSFGVGNEAEGRARIDAIVDSVLAANPDVIFVTSAGNDGPGLSTQGFPATARRPITVGATWPAIFSGVEDPAQDLLAFFSARGGEMAKPDVVAPGFAYATVPVYNTGDEVKNGTSMASPHVAGIAARLVSSRPRGQAPGRAEMKQALMVTARPFAGASYLDQGTGQVDIVAAHRWLEARHPVEEVEVEAGTPGHTAVWRGDGLRSAADTVERFTVRRRAGSPPATFRLRSSAAWLRAPATITVGATAQVPVSWNREALTVPGTYSGVVTGWPADTAAGPSFRLVTTIVVPEPGLAEPVRRTVTTDGGAGRVFFRADSARPFDVRVTTANPQRTLFALLYEPGGQPWRSEPFVPAGFGENAALFMVDGRDASRGTWQVAVAARVGDTGAALVEVQHSPVRLLAGRDRDSLRVELAGVTDAPVSGDFFAGLVGAERGLALTGQGGALRRIPIRIPGWAARAIIDVAMPRDEWPRFTDFGFALLDADGQIVGSEPMNYHTARLQTEFESEADRDGALVFLPGFANPGAQETWQLAVTIRFYADRPEILPGGDGTEITVPGGGSFRRAWGFPPLPWPLPDAFVPLGQVALVTGDRVWVREVTLAPPLPAVRP